MRAGQCRRWSCQGSGLIRRIQIPPPPNRAQLPQHGTTSPRCRCSQHKPYRPLQRFLGSLRSYISSTKKKKLQVLYWGVQGDKKKIGSELPGPNRMCGQQLATKWNKTSWYVLETTLPPIIMVFCGKNGCVSSIISFLEKLVGNLHWTIIMGERVSLLGGSSHLQAIKRSWMEREQGPTTPVLGDNNDRHGS